MDAGVWDDLVDEVREACLDGDTARVHALLEDKFNKAVARPLLLRALARFPDVKGAAQVHNVASFVNAELREAGFSFTIS